MMFLTVSIERRDILVSPTCAILEVLPTFASSTSVICNPRVVTDNVVIYISESESCVVTPTCQSEMGMPPCSAMLWNAWPEVIVILPT